MCKSASWNQGGYDVVWIEKGADVPTEGTSRVTASYHLFFGQVTKSTTHSLKLPYFSEFSGFIIAAGFIVSSIEIGFIVPSGRASDFKVTASQVTGKGLLSHYEEHGASPSTKWKKSREHELVTMCELNMSAMNFHNSL
jgi:hypothetical protein